jgi:Na+:H+ antiporter, NhaA family
VLLCCTIISLFLSNFSFTGNSYSQFWHTHFVQNQEHYFKLEFIHFPNSIINVINDFLMAIFFFLVTMEIKREMLEGELSSFKKSILPVVAAIGGMIFPALIFFIINANSVYTKGWAIPTATDIAFTLGIATLLGKRVPNSLKIFLTALAIIDDLGAIVVIAIFYGSHIHYTYLLLVVLFALVLYVLNKYKIKFGIFHCVIGLAIWICMFNAGIHATVAGVVFAAFVPKKLLHQFEMKLHNIVYFFILPLFVLANTAIVLPNHFLHNINNSLSWGIIAGLCIGKPLGIFIACFLLIKYNVASLPSNVNLKTLLSAAMLAGIGFTMSIFIATLAFNNVALQDVAKIATLIASVIAMLLGSLLMVISTKKI